ncbi:hypothetical protein QTP88_019449 [Uroleucon formosanum]
MSYNLKVQDAYLCVFKTMFLNTLRLGEKQVLTWCLTAKDNEKNYEKNKENNKSSTLKITPEKRKRISVTEFLNKLSKFILKFELRSVKSEHVVILILNIIDINK